MSAELPPVLEAALDALARDDGPILVASDFDGTLAPIVPHPPDARPIPGAVEALSELARRDGVEVAVVSGRSLEALRELGGFAEPVHLIGSHGAEIGGPPQLDSDQRDRLDRIEAALRQIASLGPGMTVEGKPAGFALHFRNAAPDVAAQAEAQVRAGPAAEDAVHLEPGKKVLELSVVQADKGRSLDALRGQLGATRTFFAGDDVTDESVFERLGPGDVGVKVGEGGTAAAYRVDGPVQVLACLRRILALRTP